MRKVGREKQLTGLAATGLLLVTLLLVTGAQGTSQSSGTGEISRREPIEIVGSELGLFRGASLDDLSVHVYDGSDWHTIPFQFDEVNAAGTYAAEDGLLDDNDVLVLMATDLGDRASITQWLPDEGAREHTRYELEVTNPLSPTEQGWAYLYRSTTLTPSLPADYVRWDEVGDRIEAVSYTVGFSPTVHAGVEVLKLNGDDVDLLDRTKLRVNATCLVFGIPVGSQTLTENDLAGLFDVTPSIDGPVRVGGGTVDSSSWFYPSLFRLETSLSLDEIPPPEPCGAIRLNWIRLSTDWLNPATTGMTPTIYYDANTPAGVAVDGQPDMVPDLPLSTWKQISGAQGGIVQIALATLEGGEVRNYYKDDATLDGGDTGQDLQSFGDAGFFLNGPSGQVSLGFVTYVLVPDVPNEGALYDDYFENPLRVTARAQDHLFGLNLPLVVAP
ncbi:MAG: hypothetical protein P8129_02020 [Anaerolineae bacterium]